jgi:hypothetical protein
MSNIDLEKIEAAFKVYEEKEKELQQASQAKQEAQDARSEAIRAIVAAAGGRKKFDRHGKKLSVVERGHTVFFRGAGYDEDVISL